MVQHGVLKPETVIGRKEVNMFLKTASVGADMTSHASSTSWSDCKILLPNSVNGHMLTRRFVICSCQHSQIYSQIYLSWQRPRLCRFTRHGPDDLAETMYDEEGRSLKPGPSWSCDSPGKINMETRKGRARAPLLATPLNMSLLANVNSRI